jgi:hypothetical protein
MALKTKVDYFGLASAGIEVVSTSENKTQGSVSAVDETGFIVAMDTFGDETLAPTCDYVVTADATLANISLGQVTTVENKQIALGSLTITTRAGEAPTISASGSQIEAGGKAHCLAKLNSITLSGLFHAQNFDLFTIDGGQLTDSTLTAEGNIGTAVVDGVIKASDLVGGKITISGTLIGVNDLGEISTPTVTPSDGGIMTQPLTESNPNGDYPTYTFTCEFPLTATNA